VGCYVLGAFALTYRLWADPAGQMVAGNAGDINLFSWFMRDVATAVSHGHLPALVTTGLNAPQGINLMWNTSELLPGVVLAPVTLLAGPQTSLNVLLTVGFAGSAASLFLVLRRWDVSVIPAAIGGAVYGFSPALITSGIGHFQLEFAVLPPLIIHMVLRLVTGRGHALRTGLYLGLLTAAQVFIGEELLVDTAVAAAVILVVLVVTQPRAAIEAVTSRARAVAMAAGLGIAAAVALVICAYPLWVQFRGPLHEHGSPWDVPTFHSYLYGFVTPSGSLLFHTSASAFKALHYPEPLPEYLAYVGWPLLIVALVAAVAFWRDPKVRLAALTFVILEWFTLGAVTVTSGGTRYPAALLPAAYAFDHYTHIRADLFPPRGPLPGPPPPSDELRLVPALDWIEAALPQQNAGVLAALSGPVRISVTGPGARTIQVGRGEPVAEVSSDAPALVRWITQRGDWEQLGVKPCGDQRELGLVAQLKVF